MSVLIGNIISLVVNFKWIVKKEVEHLVQSNKADSLVLYRLPHSKEIKLVMGVSEKLHYGVNEQVIARNGFVFEPFDNVEVKGVFINETLSAEGLQFNNELRQLLSTFYTSTQADDQKHCGYDDYQQQFDLMYKAIADKHIDKVILSRTMAGPALNGAKVIELFEELCGQYPHAFVYAVNTPESGVWVGAGPELLLKNDGSQLSTVSLAGTLPNISNSEWSNKELEEQALVTDYIEQVLLSHQVTAIKEEGPETIGAGQVKHLCTYFSFDSALINGNHLGLLYELHPTPAVCGMPKKESYQLILDVEKHDRAFYSGFLGPVGEGRYEFYVNIRCLKVYEKSSALFIGGGVIKDSKVKKEWEETELKAQTLLSVLKNIKLL